MSDTGQDHAGEQATADAKAERRRRIRRITFITLFVVSLGFNVFAAGWLGTRWWIMGGGWHHHMLDAHPVVEETWDRHAGAVDGLRVDLADALAAMADALDAEPFDQQAYDDAVTQLSTAGQGLVGVGGMAAQDIGAGLNAQQRERIARRARRMARHIRNWDGPDDWYRRRERRRGYN